MILTKDFSRVAVLSDEFIDKLVERYHLLNLLPRGKRFDPVVGWNANLAKEISGKEDLVTEWILKSISEGKGRVDDFHRFAIVARFYFTNYKSDKFKKAAQIVAARHGKTVNPKNLLDFNLYLMEDIRDEFEKQEIDPRVNLLAKKLPDGASMLYNDGICQIVEVTSPEAACDLGRGTKWCTSSEETAEEYLEKEPLYVIYVNGKKTAQLYIGIDPQLNDLRDRPLGYMTDGLRHGLEKTGLFEKIINSLEANLGEVQYGEAGRQLEGYSKTLAALVGDHPSSELMSYVADRPALAFLYAYGVLGAERFPQGEQAIATDSLMSLWYAEHIIGGRWKPGEPIIFEEDVYLQDYIDFLGRTNYLAEFERDYPEVVKGQTSQV